MVKVLFVCMGNICRSPTAEGLMRHLASQRGLDKRIAIDSAGTHAYHVGEPPDPRSAAEALRRGIDLSAQRARKVRKSDFDDFDYVLALDEDNMDLLKAQCPAASRDRLRLLCSFAPRLRTRDVPDPYYGGDKGFERVFDIIEAGVSGLLDHIEENHFGDNGKPD